MPSPTPTDQYGFELGEILSDFEQDHNAEKAVKNIVELISRTKEAAVEEILRAAKAIYVIEMFNRNHKKKPIRTVEEWITERLSTPKHE